MRADPAYRKITADEFLNRFNHLFSGTSGIVIPALDLTIPHVDVFARV